MKNINLPPNWDSLPIEEVLMSGVRKKIKYDQSSNTVYMLNDRGEWTGEKAHPPARKSEPNAEAAGESDGQSDADDVVDDADAVQDRTPMLRRKKRKKVSGVNILLTTIIIVLVGVLLLREIPFGQGPRTFEVMIAMESIEPGTSVKGKLSSKTISASEYQQYISSGGIYLAAEYEDIKDYKATTYIPQNGFITYSNIGKSYNAKNPWTSEGAAHTILIPVSLNQDNLEEFIWGNIVTITIYETWKTTSKDVPDDEVKDRPSSPEVNGSTIVETYRTDTYVLNGFTIIDVLNAKKESIYSSYAAMIAVPDAYRDGCIKSKYSTKEKMEADKPAYIRIAVSKETAEWWSRVTNVTKGHTIKVSTVVTGFDGITGDGEYTYKSEVNEQMRKMAATIKAAWAKLKEDS